ncbi:hypothetical protein KRR55_13195 [Paeniglutamicibacter sp. ABSL32-1]|uniref:hypothetical protein n=1 Tax=Paeniglutamicibacter quisquiliarum TaxID=2849498 RepID=UPI001C2DE9B3|nr:hypothetical protein [Paeniglutamicibacter quisquiliarum]MBV1780067.1 hypothetical protein [Paeniglutamicibacter quisquiliarum]
MAIVAVVAIDTSDYFAAFLAIKAGLILFIIGLLPAESTEAEHHGTSQRVT